MGENGSVNGDKVGRRNVNGVDWNQYGLASDTNHPAALNDNGSKGFLSSYPKEEVKELFEHEQENGSETDQEPWWKSNFFVTKKVLFGTWDGVFTSCVMNIVGVVVFLRTGWMVGFAGTGLSLLILLISFLVALVTLMSAVGVSDRCDLGHGGVYFILTHVLGGKVGGTVGLMYCVGHCIATSLYCTGFSESMVGLMNWDHPWAIRLVSIITLVVLVGIALSGVKWIVRFQLVLIIILAIAMCDFILGTLAQEKPESGFSGFKNANFVENLKSDFNKDISFFVVFGVFFPTACGVLAGVNMSGDLKEPGQNIPEGSVAALALCGFIYTILVLFLGSTCTREALQTDSLIMEKISLVGALLIFGLFVAALSSILGGLVGPPRVLQRIAEDNVLPILKPFAELSGGNKEPRNATLLCASIALIFIFVGNLNQLAPIVTMPFLMTYTIINYAYFAMAMSYDVKLKQTARVEGRYNSPTKNNNKSVEMCDYGSTTVTKRRTWENGNEYHELTSDDGGDVVAEEETVIDNSKTLEVKEPPDYDTSQRESGLAVSDHDEELNVESNRVSSEDTTSYQRQRSLNEGQYLEFIHERNTNTLYGRLCNRWVSLFTSFVCLVLSFCVSWAYALANLSITLILFIFVSQARPGLSPGVASDFNFGVWLCTLLPRDKKDEEQEHVIIQSSQVPYGISMHVITQENMDYEHRDRKHLASTINKPQPYH
ncbi:solute carrier family 12 member 8-like [Clytia hemisphaerica]|uniref:Solute carrier family 12 member 9 n=1 Tax=Clytia hemisphaerica TaxID=252671 RepID=A0A7M5V9X1_9CNID